MNSAQRNFDIDFEIFQKIIDYILIDDNLIFFDQDIRELKNSALVSNFLFYIVDKKFANFIYRRKSTKNDGQSSHYIDSEESYCIEFYFSKNKILQSRLKYNRFYFDTDYNKIYKSEDFIKWADSLLNKITNFIKKEKKLKSKLHPKNPNES
jgi:hypothetical protein